MTKHIGTFVATSESGTEFTINVFQRYADAKTRGGTESLPGLRFLETDDGYKVNRVETGVYEVLSPGGLLRVTSDDPDAP